MGTANGRRRPTSWPASRGATARSTRCSRRTCAASKARWQANADEVVIFGAASEAFSQKNINCSIAESIARFEPVAKAAKDAGVRLRGSISCSLGCPYQGEVPVASVVDVVERMKALGCDEIDIADTIGVGTPKRTREVLAARVEGVSARAPLRPLSRYLRPGLANIYAALQEGIEIFHASVAGLGGCPYAKGATGNVATEDVVYLMNGLGIETGVDLDQLIEIGDFISRAIGKPSSSRAGQALLAKKRDGVDALRLNYLNCLGKEKMNDMHDIDALPESARRVARLLQERGHPHPIVMLPETGKTSAEAAAGLGCSVAQIAKSILFRRREDDAPVLVIASGVNRVERRRSRRASANLRARTQSSCARRPVMQLAACVRSVTQRSPSR